VKLLVNQSSAQPYN